jgi:hypothetical protein
MVRTRQQDQPHRGRAALSGAAPSSPSCSREATPPAELPGTMRSPASRIRAAPDAASPCSPLGTAACVGPMVPSWSGPSALLRPAGSAEVAVGPSPSGRGSPGRLGGSRKGEGGSHAERQGGRSRVPGQPAHGRSPGSPAPPRATAATSSTSGCASAAMRSSRSTPTPTRSRATPATRICDPSPEGSRRW